MILPTQPEYSYKVSRHLPIKNRFTQTVEQQLNLCL